MTPRPVRILFAGGGTGGHLYPAIAIADRIRDLLGEAATEILFVGTKRGLEYRIREKLGYPLTLINIRGFSRSLSLKNLLLPFLVVGALIKSTLLIRSFKPDVIVGTGGYVCWPILKAAGFLNVPTVLQEQNSLPGVTIRQNAGRARRLYLGFADAQKHLSTRGRVLVTGNPIRRDIDRGNREEALEQFGLSPDKKTILVLGGSQGARAINNAIAESLMHNTLDTNFQILWQTGKRDYTDVSNRLADRADGHALFPFAHDMKPVYAAADVAVARAGALTLAELVACRIPAVLVPFPHAAGDHQRQNARSLEERGAAVVVDEDQLAGTDLLAKAVEITVEDTHRRMTDALTELSAQEKPAVDIIAGDIIELIMEKRKGG